MPTSRCAARTCLFEWGALKWPPIPPNARRAPAQPWRASVAGMIFAVCSGRWRAEDQLPVRRGRARRQRRRRHHRGGRAQAPGHAGIPEPADGVRLSAGHGRPQHLPLAAPRARPRSRRGVPRRRARRVPPAVRPDRDRPAPRRGGVARARARGLRPSARFDTLARRRRPAMTTLVRNIGTLVSGDIGRPLLDADSLVIRDGQIAAVGRGLDEDADTVIDARGTTVTPGLIDSHVHPVFGDFTPRQRTIDFIDSGMNGGVTTAISAGEVHLPGRPKDIVGLKALAIVAAKSYANFRPGGVKVHAGAPILELGLSEADFVEMAAAGVRLVGEIGLGSVKTGKDAAPMVRWAKAHGMTVTIHTGGPSIAGSNPINADVVLEAQPHVVGHINGGTTSMSPAEIERLVATDMALEIVQCGSMKTALHTLRVGRDARALHRLIVGNDAPSGTGVIPLGVLRTLSLLAGLGGLDPAEAIACATGNTARVYKLDVGLIEVGRAADLVICDAPTGSIAQDALGALSAGDLPGISMVLIDGRITIGRSRNTPPAARAAEVVKGLGPAGAGH